MVKSIFTVAVCCKLAGGIGLAGLAAGGYEYTHQYIETVPGHYYNLPDYWEAEEDLEHGVIRLETKPFQMEAPHNRNDYDIVNLKAALGGLPCDGPYRLNGCDRQEAEAKKIRHMFCQHANLKSLPESAKPVKDACLKDMADWQSPKQP